MRRRISSISLFQATLPAAVFLVLGLALAPMAAAQAIKISPETHDFGRMNQDESRTITLTVSNEGAGLLELRNVDADCGCTVPTLQKDNLGPMESTTIEVQFNSQKFDGDIVKRVIIESNDPMQPEVEFYIYAHIYTPLKIDPVSQRVGFPRSLKGEVQTRTVTFTATDAEALQISAEQTQKGLFQVGVKNGVEGNPKVSVLEVTLPADMEIGRVRDSVRVKTNVPDRLYVDIEMQSNVVAELLFSPADVNFRYQKEFNKTIRLAPFQKGEIEFKITGAEIDLPEIAIEIVETIPNAETLVVLRGAPIAKTDPRAVEYRGRIKGVLKIHTDLPSTPLIEVPVAYMIRM